ncbi:hypothetical protein RWE15_24935 [Virgibacillus halophilus]|uniref:Uncharacterized protein n=1 Tax=Tigheibacillus halophilus TaxID=361280 RepID=A0ABU5CCA1_9BACI|nr:hypothetical protein [Virgibacillus halophilus]
MEHLGTNIMTIIEHGGILAPVLFIGFHLLRPLFFFASGIHLCHRRGFIWHTSWIGIFHYRHYTVKHRFFMVLFNGCQKRSVN